mmetsp:Transcript_31486/g.81814  ORF Transcript_31486/g.81814 Transcript_31486/m.81814 type:complete len:649 (-) Transcript_31486:7-1953(-)
MQQSLLHRSLARRLRAASKWPSLRKSLEVLASGAPLPVPCDRVTLAAAAQYALHSPVGPGERCEALWRGAWYPGTFIRRLSSSYVEVHCDGDPAGTLTVAIAARPLSKSTTMSSRAAAARLRRMCRHWAVEDIDQAFLVTRHLGALLSLAEAAVVAATPSDRMQGALVGSLVADGFAVFSHYVYNGVLDGPTGASLPDDLEAALRDRLTTTPVPGNATDYGAVLRFSIHWCGNGGALSGYEDAFWEFVKGHEGYIPSSVKQTQAMRSRGFGEHSSTHIVDVVPWPRVLPFCSRFPDLSQFLEVATELSLLTHEHADALSAVRFFARVVHGVVHHGHVSFLELGDYLAHCARECRNGRLEEFVRTGVDLGRRANLEQAESGVSDIDIDSDVLGRGFFSIVDSVQIQQLQSSDALCVAGVSSYLLTRYPNLFQCCRANVAVGGDVGARAVFIGAVHGALAGRSGIPIAVSAQLCQAQTMLGAASAVAEAAPATASFSRKSHSELRTQREDGSVAIRARVARIRDRQAEYKFSVEVLCEGPYKLGYYGGYLIFGLRGGGFPSEDIRHRCLPVESGDPLHLTFRVVLNEPLVDPIIGSILLEDSQGKFLAKVGRVHPPSEATDDSAGCDTVLDLRQFDKGSADIGVEHSTFE